MTFPKLTELHRVMVGSFALYWADKLFEVVHFHPSAFGLGEEGTAYAVFAASGLFSLAAGLLWLFATYCWRTLKAMLRKAI